MSGKCSFSDCWLKNSSYKLWLERDMDKFEAKWKVCLKAFDVSNMGESALKSSEKEKHFVLWKHNISFEDPEVEAHR